MAGDARTHDAERVDVLPERGAVPGEEIAGALDDQCGGPRTTKRWAGGHFDPDLFDLELCETERHFRAGAPPGPPPPPRAA